MQFKSAIYKCTLKVQVKELNFKVKFHMYTIRGDLEKVKKHLKKNDVNSVDGQGR